MSNMISKINNAAVKVCAHPKTGAIWTAYKSTPDYGSVRVEKRQVLFTEGRVSVRNTVAFIPMSKEDATILAFKEGDTLEGRIQIKISSEPFYMDQEPVINPTTNKVALRNGKPYYRTTLFVPKDELVSNQDEVTAMAAIVAAAGE